MNKFKKNKGFTLIELLVALVIVGIILLSFFKSVDSTIRMDAKNDRDIKALNIAQSEIENLRNQIKNGIQPEEIKDKTYEKSIDGKAFDVTLDISKSEVNNANITNEIYMYTINIKVKSLDEYFTKKETKIQNVKILSKNKS